MTDALTDPPPSHPPTYRPDIDGVRAIAVAWVLLYHAFPAWLPGGFVGVDMFFVISGYLITQVILRGLQSERPILLVFYRRRILRLVPALLPVLTACVAFGWFVLTPNELKWLGKSVAWSAPFMENALLAVSGGYFEDATYLNPLLHLWSLGVEEQFYLVWPILLIMAVKHRVAWRVVGAVTATSLIISFWDSLDAPAVHFYHLSCRVWELGTGALLALPGRWGASWPTRHHLWHQLLSLGGLSLVVGGGALLDGDHSSPSIWAAIPTVGTACLIAAGPQTWINRRILSSRPLTFVGRISYSLYLWHWPILAFSRLLLGSPPSSAIAIAALAGAVAVACVSYYFVEKPARSAAPGGPWVPLLLTPLAVFIVVGIGFDRQWISARLSGSAVAAIDGAAYDWGYPPRIGPPVSLTSELVAVPSRRHDKILFVGDSHVQQYYSHVRAVLAAHPESARTAEFATYLGCPPLPGVETATHGIPCGDSFKYAIDRASRDDVDTVVFGAFWEAYFLGEFSADHRHHTLYRSGDLLRTPLDFQSRGAQLAFDEFQVIVSTLVARGRRVFIMLSNPTSSLFDPASMLDAHIRLALHVPTIISVDPHRRTVDPSAFESFVAPISEKLRTIAAESGAVVLDPRDSLCDAGGCATTTGNDAPLYKDSNHLRPFFARERATFLDAAILGPAGEAVPLVAPSRLSKDRLKQIPVDPLSQP